MTTTELTTTQRQVLEHAADHAGGCVGWFPENVKGGARKKVLDALFNRALVTANGTEWFIAAQGYDALGRPRPAPAPLNADPEIEAHVTAAEATWTQERTATKPRTRESSKQAIVIRMLQRPEGATVYQICEATGWQAHTVRGMFSGAFKKKLGLAITSTREQDADRVYKIAT